MIIIVLENNIEIIMNSNGFSRSQYELQSQVIAFLRFPLIVCLVFFHSTSLGVQIGDIMFEGDSANMPLHYYSTLIFQGPFAFRNQFFYFVSGFLFFLNVQKFDFSIYKKKIKNRINSLLVPYLFWNFVVFAVYFTLQTIPQLSNFTNKDIHLHDFFSYFWNNEGAMKADYSLVVETGNFPIAYQFWFIRDLMIAILLSPAIYFFCKKTKIYGILLLGVLWIMDWWVNIPGFSSFWVFFFTAGAYFGIHKRNLIEDFGKLRILSFVLFPVIVIIYCLVDKDWGGRGNVQCAAVITGIVFCFNFVAYLFENGTIKSAPKFLGAATFFIFATHDPFFINGFRKLTYLIIHPESDLAFTTLFFVNSILVVLCALGLYYLLRRFLPKFTQIITGGR